MKVSARANVGSLRAWCEGLLCGCRWAASWDDDQLLLYMQVYVSDVQVSTTQRGKISVLGLTLDKAVYTLAEGWSVSAHILHTSFPVQSHTWFPECFPKPGEKNRKSIIYTHRRNNLVLTTSGTSCSGGTKRHINSLSHTDTEPDGAWNFRSVLRVHVVQQDCWRPEKTG